MAIDIHEHVSGGAAATERSLDYVRSHERARVAKRIDIARHWIEKYSPGWFSHIC